MTKITTTIAVASPYTAEQWATCEPIELYDQASDEVKAGPGGRVLTQTATITAPEGYVIDTRPSVLIYETSGIHVNQPGKPVVTKRNGIKPTQMKLTSSGKRGRSLRAGRTIKVTVLLKAFAIKDTPASLSVVGLI